MFLSERTGIFYLWYQDRRGKRKKVSTTSRSESEALRFPTSFSVSKGSNKAVISRLSDFSRRVLQYVQTNYARRTYPIYRDNVARSERIIGDIPIDQFTPDHFDLFKSERLQKVSPKTANKALRNIKAVRGFAVRWKILDSAPSPGSAWLECLVELRCSSRKMNSRCSAVPSIGSGVGRQYFSLCSLALGKEKFSASGRQISIR